MDGSTSGHESVSRETLINVRVRDAGVSRSDPAVLHVHTHRLSMRDVDAAGVIYYPVAAALYEATLTGWLNVLGHGISTHLRDGVAIPAVESRLTFSRPLSLDQLVSIRLRVSRAGGSSFTLRAEFVPDGSDEVAIVVETTHVWVELRVSPEGDGTHRRMASRELPPWLDGALRPEGAR